VSKVSEFSFVMGLIKVVGILIDIIFGINEYLDITRLHNLIGKYHICQTVFVKIFNYFKKWVEVSEFLHLRTSIYLRSSFYFGMYCSNPGIGSATQL
jgi:hypothetical protein